MTYISEFSIDTFPFWSGAIDVIKKVKQAKKLDELGQLIEDCFDCYSPTKTEINDFVWFNAEYIYEQLQINS